jgi:hypothetical protein
MSAFEFARSHPFATGFAVAAPAAFGFGAYRTFRRDQQDEPDLSIAERSASAAVGGANAALGAGAVVGGGMLAWHARRSIAGAGTGVAKWMYKDAFTTSDAIRKGLMARGENKLYAAVHGYGSSGVLMAGTGALLGGAIGARYGHPALGMAIGAGAGMAVKAGLGASRFWKRMEQIPGGRTMATVGLSLALYHVTNMARGPQPDSTVYGVREDSTGGYDYSADAPAPRAGVKDRMRRIGATGDITLGLHSQR